MAYDETAANRLRAAFARALGPADEIEEKRMFGGLSEMVNGHMCIGLLGETLVVHLPDAEADACLSMPHVRPMDFTGKPMRGWLYVSAEGYRTERDLDVWVRRALDFVHAAGPKKARGSAAKEAGARKAGGSAAKEAGARKAGGSAAKAPAAKARRASPKKRAPKG